MGKFADLHESTVPQKRTFKVHAKDEHGKDYSFNHEAYSPRGIHKSDRFEPSKPGGYGGLGHKLVKITHNGNDVTNESTINEVSVPLVSYGKGSGPAHIKMNDDDSKRMASLKHGETSTHFVSKHDVHLGDKDAWRDKGKVHKIKAVSHGNHIAIHDHDSGEHLGVVHPEHL